ncbi:MAG: histidyl-tRNA synthetase [Pseudohongiellaceae bacterium]
MKTNTAPPRGMRDLLPADVALRDQAAAVIQASYQSFGFSRIETPALEHIGLLCSGQGGDNEKLIYKVLKRGRKLDVAAATHEDEVVEFGLRFDLTVPLARFYAQNQGQLLQPFKAMQIGPVWRAERPQKGRYRQFTQCDIDLLGEAGPLAEIELIAATAQSLAALGLTDIQLRINDRQLLSAIVAHCGFDAEAEGRVFVSLDKLDKIGVEGVSKELADQGHGAGAIQALMALLVDRDGGLAAMAAALGENDPRTAPAVERLTTILGAFSGRLPGGGSLSFDPTLVRGMGYYTGSIFEVGLEGLPFSIAGGGRYDGMIGALQGRDVPACGFSIGFERVLLVLAERGWQPSHTVSRVALLYDDGDPAALLAQAEQLRQDGSAVSLYRRRKNTARQLQELATAGYTGVARFSTSAEGRPDVQALGED